MHIMILQAAKPNGMYVYKSLPLVSFMQVVRKAGSEEKLKAVFHSRSLHCFCFVFCQAKQSKACINIIRMPSRELNDLEASNASSGG